MNSSNITTGSQEEKILFEQSQLLKKTLTEQERTLLTKIESNFKPALCVNIPIPFNDRSWYKNQRKIDWNLRPRIISVDEFTPFLVGIEEGQIQWISLYDPNTIPNEIYQLVHIRGFRLKFVIQNSYQPPSEMGNWASLETLVLEELELPRLPSYFQHFTKLKIVDLNLPELQSFPQELCRAMQMEQFFLSSTKPIRLMDKIGQWIMLREISIVCNTSGNTSWKPFPFPESFFNLEKLEIFKLESGLKIKIPPEFAKLKSLREIYWEEIQIELENGVLPNALTMLDQLEILHIRRANIEQLPDLIINWKNLRILDLAENQWIHPSIKHLMLMKEVSFDELNLIINEKMSGNPEQEEKARKILIEKICRA